jgi:RNA polymerase sigma-70 factor (ECF subfamily)
MANPDANSEEIHALLQQAAAGDQAAWGALLERHRPQLRRMVELRLDPRLQGRLDASDVVQEAYLTASVQLADYLRKPAIAFPIWLRLVTGQRLQVLHRQHLGTKARDARLNVSIDQPGLPAAGSDVLAGRLMGREPSPSEAACAVEQRRWLREALERMEPLDREVLALRHYEGMSNAEAAQVLGLGPSAASKRYVRALQRVKEALSTMPGGPGEQQA